MGLATWAVESSLKRRGIYLFLRRLEREKIMPAGLAGMVM